VGLARDEDKFAGCRRTKASDSTGPTTSFASLSAGLFLLSVCLTQPFWVPGTTPTYLYWIEMAACFVIFTPLAGRMAGLDYIIDGFFKADKTTNSAEN